MQGHGPKIYIVNPIMQCQWEGWRPRAGLGPEIHILGFSAPCVKNS